MVALLASTTAKAYDFTVGGIYYNITDATNKKVAVTYNVRYSASYTGAVTIPTQVTNGVNTYSVTGIGDFAFYYCANVTAVTIPNSVTSIGNNAFGNCTGLTSITIPNSVTSIGSSAFSICTGLTSINIPNSVTNIGYLAFFSCTGLTSITIPNSITSINGSTFSNCTGLTSITIPNTVTSIGGSAFDHCSSLTSVTIPNSVTSIGDSGFSYCSGLTSITIPSSVTSIGVNTFGNCTGLTSVTIPNSVTSIGDYAFSACTGLNSVFVSWTTPLSISSNVFDGLTLSNVHLYVPAGKEATYDATAVWTDFIISAAPSVFVKVKAFLKGPLNGTTMSTTLNTNNLIPIAQPYSGAPWNYAGTSTESVTAIPTNVTDWVLVELRDATTPATVVATRAAFILSDGSIVDTDGSSPVEFKNMLAGNYHIAIRHRNHLAIRTATAQALGSVASGAVLYDFTTAQSKANGTNPMVKSGTVYAMWSGDVNSDGNVYNTASPQDASQVVNGVANKTGNTFHLPSYGGYKSVYNVLDVNMDGNVYNTATPQDASNIVNNVANAPGNTFHLPSYSGLKAKL